MITLVMAFIIIISMVAVVSSAVAAIPLVQGQIPIEEQLRLAREKNSTAQTDGSEIQPEHRFTIGPEKGVPPPLKILSQSSDIDIRGLLTISGEVMNVSPTGEIIGDDDSAWVVATFFDANNEVLGTEGGIINYDPDYSGEGMIPNQVYTYEVSAWVSEPPYDETASYSLSVDWLPDFFIRQ